MVRLTEEQMEVVYSEADNTYVKARAGTGKTTTLAEFVRIRKKDKFLYLVYNKAIKDEASAKFPENTNVQTIHSLAYSVFGEKYADKLSDEIKVIDIFKGVSFFNGKDINDEEVSKLCLTVVRTLKRFFNYAVGSLEEMELNSLVCELASEYWMKMKSESLDVCMTHEGYLKLYQLSNPILNYDYIIVDEAQDSNEVMLDIVYKQDAKKVFVGDEHQMIYGFRGAKNIFIDNPYKKEDDLVLTLTESFRFGKEIASVANVLLVKYKKEVDLVKGTNKEGFISILDESEPYTIITRTNAHLFDLAYDEVQKGRKIHIIGGYENLFNSVKDGYYLFIGEKDKIKSEFLKSFKNFFAFKEMVERVKMGEYKFLINILEKYGDGILRAIVDMQKSIVGKKQADVTFVTAHKSKGLQFLNVRLANDFAELFDKKGNEFEVESDEINLLYVAVTRAMERLEVNSQVRRLL